MDSHTKNTPKNIEYMVSRDTSAKTSPLNTGAEPFGACMDGYIAELSAVAYILQGIASWFCGIWTSLAKRAVVNDLQKVIDNRTAKAKDNCIAL